MRRLRYHREVKPSDTTQSDKGKAGGMHLSICWVLALLFGFHLTDAQIPHSPCPDTFWYERDPGGGWHGVLRVVTVPWFSTLTITLSLASRRHLMSSGVPPGNLTLRGGEKAAREAINEAAQGRSSSLVFDAIVPAVPQPTILNATVDGRVVCIVPDPRDPPSTVWLQYTLRSTPQQLGSLPPSPAQQPAPGQFINIILSSNRPPQITYPSSGGSSFQPQPQPQPQPFPEYPEYPEVILQPAPPAPQPQPLPPPPRPPPSRPPPSRPPPSRPPPSRPPPSRPPPSRPAPSQPQPQWPPSPQTEKPPKIEFEWPSSAASSPAGSPANTECGRDVQMPNQLVLNGPKAKPYSWPWHAAIYQKQGGDTISFMYICGGTLVSPYFVLTAAHCANGAAQDLVIFLGKYDISSLTERDQQSVQPDYIYKHPDYREYLNDVALMRLSTPALITATVGIACLWSGAPDLNAVVGQVGWVPGWGKDDSGKISAELRVAGMPIVSQETCLRSDNFYAKFTSEMTFCAGFRNGTGVCNGDSGGGLFLRSRDGKWLLRGIVSLARTIPALQSCDAQFFVVFSDVAKFGPWIQQSMTALQPR